MTTTAKPCTKCREVKPLSQFYLIRAGDPSGPRRADCKACHLADCSRRRAEGPSVISELVRVGMSDPESLSEKARAAVFTEAPIDPAVIAACLARQAKEARRKQRAELRTSREVRPMRFARMEEYA